MSQNKVGVMFCRDGCLRFDVAHLCGGSGGGGSCLAAKKQRSSRRRWRTDDGKLIGNCADGTVMYRATPEKYEELGRFRSNATICTSPAIVGGRMFLRLKDGVACYDLTQYGP